MRLYGEIGRYLIAIEILCNSSKYLNRLTHTEENSLLHQCLLENLKSQHKVCWCNNITKILPLDLKQIVLNE